MTISERINGERQVRGAAVASRPLPVRSNGTRADVPGEFPEEKPRRAPMHFNPRLS
jgi:hypothetical protein